MVVKKQELTVCEWMCPRCRQQFVSLYPEQLESWKLTHDFRHELKVLKAEARKRAGLHG